MIAHSMFYRDLAYVFTAALLGGVVALKLRQPLILGYVLGGILIGPFTPGPTVSEIRALELLAEIGVILLMYSIGMEFSIKDLLQVKWVSLIGGPLGIFAVIASSVAVGSLMHWSLQQSISIGATVSLASTMVLSHMLISRGELHSQHGRAMIGITLVDDLVFVVMVVLLPSLAELSRSKLLSVAVAFGKPLLILVPVVFIALKLVPPLMARVARMRSQELYVLVALALGFVTAAVTQALGLSLVLGAFLAGLIISDSEHRHQTLTQMLPFRDAFAALFFVTIGGLIDPRALISNLGLLGVVVALIVLGKFVIWTAIVRLFRYPLRTAVLVGVGLTQIGEFSYVLVTVARDAGLVQPEVYRATLAASLLTILVNALLIQRAPGWMARVKA
ncbi:MAG TPA: cation:proton antiporter [Candidatus Binatia bacterium]|nr:cation:proton antiporter [Candidatus Binatia bacterium]